MYGRRAYCCNPYGPGLLATNLYGGYGGYGYGGYGGYGYGGYPYGYGGYGYGYGGFPYGYGYGYGL